jgi:transcriptional regulator with XRE-family HTH domain
MEVFSNRLRQEARMLGLADVQVARRAGLTERRYGNYVAGIREPDLLILVKITTALSTTPNRLLGIGDAPGTLDEKATYIAILSAAETLPVEDVESVLIQIEALARHRAKKPKRRRDEY